MSRLIQAMNEVCRQARSQFLIVSCPMDEEKRNRLKSICSAEEIPYLPLDAALSESREPITFPHDPHWNATGHRLAADAIDSFLRQQRIFSAASLPSSSPGSESGI